MLKSRCLASKFELLILLMLEERKEGEGRGRRTKR